MHVSVIIPVYNDSAKLEICLNALAQQTYPSDQFEVIVVDNGSKQSPRELVESFPFCQFAEESIPGSYAARNKALEIAQGEVIAFTDADCLPDPKWLELGVKEVQQLSIDGKPFRGQIGGAIEVFPDDPMRPTPVEIYDILFGLLQEANVLECKFAATANMFTLRSVFDDVGTFSSNLKSGGDLQWGQNLHSLDRPVIYAPTVLVKHPARNDLGGITRQARRHAGGRFDKYAMKRSQMSLMRTLRAGWRLACPPLRQCLYAVQKTLEMKHSWLMAIKVMLVVLSVHYTRFFSVIGSFFSSKRERS